MKVLLLAADHGACAKYRVHEPYRVTKGSADITVTNELPVIATKHMSTGLVDVHEIQTDADLIVFQRPLDNSMSSAIVQAKRQGIATAVEMDDDLGATHRRNVAYKYFNDPNPSTGIKWFNHAVSMADFIITSTPALLHKYAPEGNGVVIRNCVPESIFDITPRYERSDENNILGWSGTIATHPEDLTETKGAIGAILSERLKSGRNVGLSVVGDPLNVDRQLRLPPEIKVGSPGWVEMEDYYEALASSMDVGIVPLEKSPFNQAKSYLKGLEMASVGIPFVASNVYEYQVFEAHGVGQTASSPSDWRRKVGRLMDNRERSVSLVKDYRDKIREDHTYEKNADLWLHAWDSAIKARNK